jgi:malate dehydrogenase (oxaloacetate-decarboxylating)(NADP+)
MGPTTTAPTAAPRTAARATATPADRGPAPEPQQGPDHTSAHNRRENALEYHAMGRPGKIAVVPTKPLTNQRDLALAYSPGVAEPCLEIRRNPEDAYRYTAKGNLVAVVTNGTAVLGLGNIGALAGKPVMEGKANLFKQFADLDVFDLEVGSESPDDVIRFCQLLEPTVGGINLEDIRAPDCFYIEETLRKTMKVPVFHDDQHGTAIISGAALLNALDIGGKRSARSRVVILGRRRGGDRDGGALRRLGVLREHIAMCDREGFVYQGRGHMTVQGAVRQPTPARGRSAT